MIRNHILFKSLRPGILLPVFFLFINKVAPSQHTLPDTRVLTMAGVHSVHIPSALNINNPACLGLIKNNIFSTGHSQPFLMKEIGVNMASAVINTAQGAFETGFSNYGIKGFQNFHFRVAYGMMLSEKFGAGITINYHTSLANKQLNYLWMVGPGAGMFYNLSPLTNLFVSLQNPLSTGNYSEYGPVKPFTAVTGITHQIYDRTVILMEVCTHNDSRVSIRNGIYYSMDNNCSLQAGVQTGPVKYYIAGRFSFKRCIIDFAFSWSPITSASPALLFSYYGQK